MKSRPTQRQDRGQASGDGAAATVKPPLNPQALRRRRVFRLAAVVVLPLLALLLAEGILRVIGYGYRTSFFVRHPATGPGLLVENQRFPWRFFPRTLARHPNPLVLSPAKAPGTCRIFVLGESAAEGDPAPAFGFSRILEVLLRERHPGVAFEVVNVAFTAINSHVIVPMARECRRLQGDFWLVYMGNNEVVGPFGAGTVLGGRSLPQPLIRATLALKTTRLGQGLDALGQRWWRSPEAALGWGGMTMFMRDQVARDDPRLRLVRDRFRANLDDIIRLGTDAGARVLVGTLVSRLRDWPPFASAHRPGLTEAERIEWERWFAQGTTAEAAGNFQVALEHYEQAARLDEEHAELQYRRGRCCLALERTAEARTLLIGARDRDTLRFRADTELNALIRGAVGSQVGRRVQLVDAEAAFARQSPHELPGEEWLYEHVHFKFAGNYLLAREFAESMTRDWPPEFGAQANTATDWLSAEACAARLACNECQQHEIARQLRRRFDEPIYRNQAGYAERMARLEQELADLRAQSKPVGRKRALDRTRQALALAPDDWQLHDLAARLHHGLDDYDSAAAEWRQVARLIPHAAEPFIELGRLEFTRGQTAAAQAWLEQAIQVNPDAAEAWEDLGLVHRRQGRRDDAERCFATALSIDPTRQAAADALRQPGQN